MEKKDRGEICDCNLKCGNCIAKLDSTVDHFRQMWKVSYFDFDQSISKVLEQDPTFINFDPLNDFYKRDDFEKCFFNKILIFLDLNFVLNKAHYASCNTKF